MSTHTCARTGKSFELRDKDHAFYARMGVPAPQWHPDEMLRHLMTFRNEWKLFRRKCDKTGEPILSAYDDKVPFPVYRNDQWWGDDWDATDYAQDYIEGQDFFAQFKRLQDKVPRDGTSVKQCENCDYNGHIRQSKNCYMNSLVLGCEDIMYSYFMIDTRDSFDSVYLYRCELCYECLDLEDCYECLRCQESQNCQNCYFSYQLQGCDHCIGCTNLQKKSYWAFNKPVGKEAFEKLESQIRNGSYETWQQGLDFFTKAYNEASHKAFHNLNSEHCVGDHIVNSQHCHYCFEIGGGEDCAYTVSVNNGKDIYHTYSAWEPGCELIYNCCVVRGVTDAICCYYTWNSTNMAYCDSCSGCEHCVGCVGLRNKKYHIFNKSYSPEEYEILRTKIVEALKAAEQWGVFFPTECGFAYNDSGAAQFYPLSQKEAEGLGYRWREEVDSSPSKRGTQGVSSNKTPQAPLSKGGRLADNISEVSDHILKEALTCQETGRPYKIVKGELAFYRKMKLPLPRLHPDQRYVHRCALRNPYQIYGAKCAMTGEEVFTSFNPQKGLKVVSEKAFLESLV